MMEEVVWAACFVAIACVGVLMAMRRRSRAWSVAGVAYGLGGLAAAPYLIVVPDPSVGGTALDLATWSAAIGYLLIFAGMIVTLVAIGRAGRRRFLVLFAGVTLAIATYQYWTTNWPARFGDVGSQCTNEGLALRGGSVERVPPGLNCYDRGNEVFVPADGLAWLALGGWSLFYGFVATFPAMGIAWLISNRPRPMRASMGS
jgi:hypothetical protein